MLAAVVDVVALVKVGRPRLCLVYRYASQLGSNQSLNVFYFLNSQVNEERQSLI